MSSNVIALDCIIVGAGLAGLAAAQALKLAGHRVKIFEKSLQKGEVGAGINVTANATKILSSWDIGNAATLYTGVKVVDVATIEGYIALADGSKHHADLIIGADGIHVGTIDVSISHIYLMFLVNYKTACIERRQFSENWVECFPIHHSTEKLMRIQDVIDIYSRKNGWWSVLTSDHQGLIWGELQNFVAYYESDEDVGSKGLGQNELLSELLAEFSKFNPIIVSILRIAEDIKPWILQYQSPLESWSRGQLLLVGDAAHPVHSVQSGQGVNLAIEDVGALEMLFGNIKSKDEILDRITTFQNVRCKRAGAVQVLSRIKRGTEYQETNVLDKWLPSHIRVFDGTSRDLFIYGSVDLYYSIIICSKRFLFSNIIQA
ncbi:hypothetical protein M431DRAFT_482399 [Trichoderma harzianum CBS 226.95]|uniref:FAD-binding domain-containing protein n=1 Tax=Trichoderma harzianum CBS 226.95 TaxID=983964 RepID=A0A2T4A8W6_TRIHA|nr:hypothetical protein M431DRAFT_482399 [Trichoderma harzianum CBS 226.95]PTB53519.1 hypothetical protein M431DRAFT_482399 [Trichoderma harzianum CBS 226.95]